MGEIVSVNFRGDELYGFKQDDGVFLALKPMVEAMGLDWSALGMVQPEPDEDEPDEGEEQAA